MGDDLEGIMLREGIALHDLKGFGLAVGKCGDDIAHAADNVITLTEDDAEADK